MAEDMQSDEQGMDAKMDPTALVREDVISDRRVGTIRMLTPRCSFFWRSADYDPSWRSADQFPD